MKQWFPLHRSASHPGPFDARTKTDGLGNDGNLFGRVPLACVRGPYGQRNRTHREPESDRYASVSCLALRNSTTRWGNRETAAQLFPSPDSWNLLLASFDRKTAYDAVRPRIERAGSKSMWTRLRYEHQSC